MAQAKEKHYALDSSNGASLHHGRIASLTTKANGQVSQNKHIANLEAFKAAGAAKHVNRLSTPVRTASGWDDIEDDEYFFF